MTSPRVAIVAAEARTALGSDLDATWAALLDGRSALAPVRGFDASGFGDPYAAQIWDEQAGAEDDPALRILGRHGQLLERVLVRVHERTQADLRGVPRERTGLFTSMGMVDSPVDDLVPAVLASRDDAGQLDLGRFFAGGYRQVHPLWPLAALNNVAASQISIDLDIRGDNVVLSSQADGAVRALLEGMYAVREGAAEAVLVGGVSEPLGPAVLARLRLRGVLGDGPAVPGAEDGAGCSPGEGAGAFVLQREISLGARRPLAFLRGGATAHGRHPDRAGPDEEAIGRVVVEALAAAGLEAGDVDAVFLHAEGRADQDRAELTAVLKHVGANGVRPRLVATKAALGHLGSGAPAVDLAVATRALAEGRLPPTPVAEEAEPWSGPLRRALVLGFGSEGGAGALVVEAAR